MKIRSFSCEIDGKISRNGTGVAFEIKSRIKIFHKLDVKMKHIMTIYKNQGCMWKRAVVMLVKLSILS